MSKLFISFANKDLALANRLALDLARSAHTVVGNVESAERLTTGDQLLASIVSSDAVLVVATEDSLKSSLVMAEVGAAWINSIRVISVLPETISDEILKGSPILRDSPFVRFAQNAYGDLVHQIEGTLRSQTSDSDH